MIEKTTKLNESFYILDIPDVETRLEISKKLSVPIKNAQYNPLVQAGIISDKEKFYRINPNNINQMMVPVGLLNFLIPLGAEEYKSRDEFEPEDVKEYIDEITPFKPYDYQEKAVINAITSEKHFIRAATGAGKSLIIGLIVDFLTANDLKGLILVPNISLVEQFNSDIKDYNLPIKNNIRLIGGDHKEKVFDTPLTISTYQSIMKFKEKLSELDFIVVDEGHGIKGNEIFDIVTKCINAKYKIGLSGTLPEEPVDRMRLISCFGKPKTYVTTNELINRGLATPVKINILRLNYKDFKTTGDYSNQLKQLKEYEPRNLFISALVNKLAGNTLVLFQHTEHGINLFTKLYQIRGIEVRPKDINGKNSLVFQKEYKIYFINGSVEGKNREIIRKILETQTNAIIIGNYACISTGVNMKNLHNMVLASPLKSYITITQSIGRGIRLHKSKDKFTLYDITDNVGLFRSQLKHRIEKSYEPEGFDINIRDLTL